jgi:hypothetical protein
MMRRPRGGRRTITGTWRTILFTVIGVVALAAGLVASGQPGAQTKVRAVVACRRL